MLNKQMMVMPPIYRFQLDGYPEHSKWGWHRATELVEAINNILILSGRQAMSPEKINATFPFVKLRHQPRTISPMEWDTVIGINEPYGGHFIGEIGWLATLVRADFYLPAKIGMQLINAAKQPIRSSIKRVIFD